MVKGDKREEVKEKEVVEVVHLTKKEIIELLQQIEGIRRKLRAKLQPV